MGLSSRGSLSLLPFFAHWKLIPCGSAERNSSLQIEGRRKGRKDVEQESKDIYSCFLTKR